MELIDKVVEELAYYCDNEGSTARLRAARNILNVIADHGKEGECPYTHPHTKGWCGYERCRDDSNPPEEEIQTEAIF